MLLRLSEARGTRLVMAGAILALLVLPASAETRRWVKEMLIFQVLERGWSVVEAVDFWRAHVYGMCSATAFKILERYQLHGRVTMYEALQICLQIRRLTRSVAFSVYLRNSPVP